MTAFDWFVGTVVGACSIALAACALALVGIFVAHFGLIVFPVVAAFLAASAAIGRLVFKWFIE